MKKITSVIGVSSATALILCIGIVAVNAILPSRAFAAEVSVQTAQLLPLGSNTCAPLKVSDFIPYVYNNALHSFSLTLQDSSYVAVVGKAGDTSIPLNLMRRRIDASGALRVQADITTTSIRGSLPITVTFMSAKGRGLPVCVSVVTATLIGTGGISEKAVESNVISASTTSGAVARDVSQPSVAVKVTTSDVVSPSNLDRGTVDDDQASKSASASATLAVTKSALTVLGDICTPKNTPTLWVILLAVYAALVAYVIFEKSTMPLFMHSQESVAASIVVPFLLLFGLWYFVESCRINAWVPVIATAIALVALSMAFWDKPKNMQGVIELPSAKI